MWNEFAYPSGGLTVRDWFAAMAVTSSWQAVESLAGGLSDTERARIAYRLADAMLAVRQLPREELHDDEETAT